MGEVITKWVGMTLGVVLIVLGGLSIFCSFLFKLDSAFFIGVLSLGCISIGLGYFIQYTARHLNDDVEDFVD